MTKDIVLVLGIGLFILAIVGRIKTPYFETGVRSTRKRTVLGTAGLILVGVFFSSELATLYRGLFRPLPAPAVFIEPMESGAFSQDVRYVGDKIHRNLAELLTNAGHRVIAPPLSVATSSSTNRMSKIFSIRLTPDASTLAIHVALADADGPIISSTELTGPTFELKEIYKVLPEAILFGLDVDDRTLRVKKTAKRPTTNIMAFAHYLNARRKIRSGNVDSAQAALERAISLDKEFALAYWSLGVLLTDEGKSSEGQKFIQAANLIDPDHSKIPLTSSAQRSNPIPNLLSAVQAGEIQELEPGFEFRKAVSEEYGVEMRMWYVDPGRFNVAIVEQKDAHGSNVREFLNDSNAMLAVNGGFFDIDASKRLSPAGVLVVNGIIRNRSPNRQSGALVRRNGKIAIIWASDLGALSNYHFVLQTGPILVEGAGQLGIRRNNYDRLNRAAVCTRGSEVIFVVLHGSRGNGLSLYEFAQLLGTREMDGGLGCDFAINLDGGPSTQFAMNVGGHREQVDGLWKVHNAIVVTKK